MRIEVAVAGVAVDGHGQPEPGAFHPQHRRVSARWDQRRVADHVVVAAEDAAAARQVGAREQTQQRLARVGERRKRVDLESERRLWCKTDEAPHRGSVRQQADRESRHLVAAVKHGQLPIIGDLADHRRGQIPGMEDALDLALTAALDDDEHPLLRFRQHHVVRRHPALTPGHPRDVDACARTFHPPSAFRHGGCEAGGAEVLDRNHGIGVRKVHARFEEAFFEEGVADLHRRPALRAVVVQLDRGERRAVDSVPAGVGTDQQQSVAGSLRPRAHQLVCTHEAYAHRVDQRVVGVAVLEIDLATDGRDADAVAVAADARDHAFEVTARVRQRAKSQRVQ